MKKYNSPVVTGNSDMTGRLIPALIAGISIAKAFALGAAAGLGMSALGGTSRKSSSTITELGLPALEPCIA